MKTLIKKILLMGAVTIFGTTLSYGQFQVGAAAGFNSSTQSELGNIWNNNDICCGFTGGLVSRYKMNDWFAIKAGVLYSQKGRSFDLLENGGGQTQNDRFSYIGIPVKAEFSAPLNGKGQKIFAAAGPYASFLLNSESEIDDKILSLDGQTNNTDFGMAFEIGYEIPVSKQDIQISLNYDMGLSEIADYDTDLRNKSFSLKVSCFF